jgi:hypothetical protein
LRARQHVGAQAQALHHAGAVAFDQRVGAVEHGQHLVAIGRRLQIDRHRAPATVQHAAPAAGQEGRVAAVLALVGLAVEADHVGPHVGQHHGAEGAGADAAELDDFQTLQGTAHALQLLVFGVQPSQRLRRR